MSANFVVREKGSARIRRRLLGAAARALSGALVLPGLAAALAPRRALAQADGPRVALVIGNADYRVAPLSNPVNDARLVAGTLQDLNFDVTLLENGSLRDMIQALRHWLIASRGAAVRAFYFAGHGTQYRGRNYLVPVDLSISDEQELDRRALVLSEVVDAVSQLRDGVNFVIVDACRTPPNLLLGKRTRGLDSDMSPGFSAEIAPRGTVVAFSTSPGALAADGAGSRNSVFTRALASQLRQPGLPVESLFKRVRVSVMRETRNAQVPWESSSLVGEFCFRPNADGRCESN
ncbi:MAG: caspase family protein [Burkholderiaceae bacterium]